jgi:hypothetical protein
VDEVATLEWIEAERGGFECGGEETLLGEGAEAAGSLRLEYGRAAWQNAIGWGRDGCVVR